MAHYQIQAEEHLSHTIQSTSPRKHSDITEHGSNTGNGHAFDIPHLEILENLAVVARCGNVPLPFVLRALVATATNPALDHPVCIILPRR